MITKNFKLHEFSDSQIAKANNIDNTPPEWVVDNIVMLVTKLLQPLRSLFGKPINISSGYRCTRLNELVNGSKTSDHLSGCAADCIVPDPKMLLALLKSSKLPFKQAILYDDRPTLLHLSFQIGHNRQEVLFYKNGKYTKLK